MQNTVTRLKPRAADYAVAAQAFLSGDFVFCCEALATNESPAGVALRARSFMRLHRYQDAMGALDGIEPSSIGHTYAGELLAIRSMILIHLRESSIEAVLTEARARAYSSGFTALESEVEYVAAVSAWASGRYDEALDGVNRVLELCGTLPAFSLSERADYLYSQAFWRSRALELRGIIYAGREEYTSQVECLVDAFREFDNAQVDDTSVELSLLRNLAVLVRDIDCDADAAYVEDRAERIAWNASTSAEECMIYNAIGWNRAMRGDHLGAFRFLRRSANCAPSVPQQIDSILDRGFLARELGEMFTALDDLQHAERLAKQVDWENTPGMQRTTLYLLAAQLAPVDAASARRLWDRYASLKSRIPATNVANRGDRRPRAEECGAHAAVLLAEGNRSRAISLLLDSLEVWTEVGYLWRVAAVALQLAELTGEDRYVAIVSRESAKRPNSWFARRLTALKAPTPV